MHYRKIDGLRFVAISFVLIAHFLYIIEKALHIAYYGVDLFFCISGFLITGILIKDSEESIGRRIYNFFGRRFLRIFPIYYLTIIVLFFLQYKPVRDYFLYFVTYNYTYAEAVYRIPVNSCTHFWSLCVEEQFYIFWPLLIFGLLSLSLSFKARSYYLYILFSAISLLALVSLAQRYYSIFPSIALFNVHGLLTNMFALCIGALGALLQKKYDLSTNRLLKSVVLEYVALVLLFFVLFKNTDLKYLICPFISLFWILKATNNHYSRPLDKFLSNPRVIWIGTISYGIYLYHWPLAHYLEMYVFDPIWNSIPFDRFGKLSRLKWNPWILAFPLYSSLSILLAALSFKYIEQPLLRYKDILFGSRQPEPKKPSIPTVS